MNRIITSGRFLWGAAVGSLTASGLILIGVMNQTPPPPTPAPPDLERPTVVFEYPGSEYGTMIPEGADLFFPVAGDGIVISNSTLANRVTVRLFASRDTLTSERRLSAADSARIAFIWFNLNIKGGTP